MDDNYIIITINGIDYYIEAIRINDLKFINNKLVNISNNSITMVNNFDYQTTYPRITCSSMSQCVLRQTQQSNYIPINSNYSLAQNQKFNINTLGSNGISILIFTLLFILVGIKFIWKK